MKGNDEYKPAEVDDKESRKLKFKLLIRALYGEFAATFIYYVCIFGSLTSGYQKNWTPDVLTLSVALVATFQAAAMIYTFANVSGAVFNPAITIAFWLTGKLSNRKCISYIIIQLIATTLAVFMVYVCFESPDQALFDFLSVIPAPGVSLWKIWATEFLSTAILTYVAFTIVYEDAAAQMTADHSFRAYADESQGLTVFAATPQSKAGFAPFVIAFTVGSLVLFSGASGAAMSPCRVFGPAVFSGQWSRWYLYYSAEIAGASLAGLVAHSLHFYAAEEDHGPSVSNLQATAALKSAISSKGGLSRSQKEISSEPYSDSHTAPMDEESNIGVPTSSSPLMREASLGTNERMNRSLKAWSHSRHLSPSTHRVTDYTEGFVSTNSESSNIFSPLIRSDSD